MFPQKRLESHVKEMRGLGDILMSHNHPIVTAEEEDDVLVLKSREVIVDGYSIIIFYSKANHFNKFHFETMQVLSRHHPFLPFWLVVKVAKAFLGSNYLSLVEIFKEGKKIYCWSVAKDLKNSAIESPYKAKGQDCVYEGFSYKSMDPEDVNFY